MKKKLRLAISARGIEGGSTGPSVYISGFVQEFLNLNKHYQVFIYHNASEFTGQFIGAKEVYIPEKNRFAWDHFLLPLALKRDNIDLSIFLKGTIPLKAPCQVIPVMYDLGYFYPKLNAYKTLETIYMRAAMRYAAKRSRVIFTASEFTRRDVIEKFAVPAEKVLTIYSGCQPDYEPITDKTHLETVRRHYKLREPFIFFPTPSISPRKNIGRLLDAFESISHLVDHHLYLTGGLDWKSKKIINRLNGPISSRVRRLGVVESQHLAAMYSLAQFTTYPTLHEGFGLPVLESFACGTPVLTSIQTSLPEVAGDAALLVDAYSIDEIAQGMLKLATDSNLRAQLVEKGFVQAREFSWEKTVGRVLDWIDSNY